MEIISVYENEKWNRIVKDFAKWDIYYLNEYAKALQLHGDGQPYLLYWENGQDKMAFVVMQNDIAEFGIFKEKINKGELFDWTTPYGYGGILVSESASAEWVKQNIDELYKWAEKNNIVSSFFRYHPLLQNQKVLESMEKVSYVKKTIYVDTASEELIWANMTPNNRNMVRKAKKNGVAIFKDHGEHLEEFMEIYNATMKKNNAEDYYYFGRDYFEYIRDNMKDNIIFFYAVYEEKIISASIFFYNEKFMHYHLSGTLMGYNKLGATNLLLTTAATWAAHHKIKKFHLGGGVEKEDSLFRFKKHFNRNGLLDFCIGAEIYMPDEFAKLVNLRKQYDETFDETKPFLIKYRG